MSSFESQERNSQNINSGNVSGSYNKTLNISQSINSGNVSGSYNNTWNDCDIRVTDERRQILEWLSPLAPQLKHRDVRRSQVEGVGDWLLQTDEFKNWNTSKDRVASPVLFCYGDPGVGKTHIRYGPTFSWENRGD